MQLPSKLFTYSESILSKFPLVLKALEKEPLSVSALYVRLQKHFSGISDFLEVLDALYALKKIDYNDDEEVLSYVI